MLDPIRPIFHRLRTETGLPGYLMPLEDGAWRAILIGAERYSVTFREDRYVGASYASLEPREGEDWNRGNDLSDGPQTDETIDRVIADIVSVEDTGDRVRAGA